MKPAVPVTSPASTRLPSDAATPTRPVALTPVLSMAMAIRAEYGSCVAIEYLQAHGLNQSEILTFFTDTRVAH
ncbi:hypothetical protein [Undibacterium squillarum]|uniref:Uncharacterized protein n=1 Tax=Undibacterium squillarum TaxID=1131567 RepID=A0ABQ2Y0W8_9BURK|nr:hypothetical protein [Undibacterium squillarum]GGX44269.1 hypothetical protein GCM10010946_23530 [Undibacterium squillarum]